jgi:DNA processing protein
VVGPVTRATSVGPHRLLRDKHRAVITDAADLYRALETRDIASGSAACLLMTERTVSSAREVRQL